MRKSTSVVIVQRWLSSFSGPVIVVGMIAIVLFQVLNHRCLKQPMLDEEDGADDASNFSQYGWKQTLLSCLVPMDTSYNNYQLPIPLIAVMIRKITTNFVEWYIQLLDDHPVFTKSITTAIIQFIGDVMAQYYENYQQQQHHHPQHQQKDCPPKSREAIVTTAQNERNDESTKRIEFSDYRNGDGIHNDNVPRPPHNTSTSPRPSSDDHRTRIGIQQQHKIMDTSIISHTSNNDTGRRQFYEYYYLRRGISAFADGLILSGPLLHYCFEYLEYFIPTTNTATTTTTASGNTLATCVHVIINDYVIDSIYILLSFAFTTIAEGQGTSISHIGRLMEHDLWSTIKASWCTSVALIPVEFLCFKYLNLSFRVLAMNFIDLLWGAIINFVSHKSRRNKTSTNRTHDQKMLRGGIRTVRINRYQHGVLNER